MRTAESLGMLGPTIFRTGPPGKSRSKPIITRLIGPERLLVQRRLPVLDGAARAEAARRRRPGDGDHRALRAAHLTDAAHLHLAAILRALLGRLLHGSPRLLRR